MRDQCTAGPNLKRCKPENRQYDNPLNQGQDPSSFYGHLIDPQTGVPSQMFCRMSDSLFFYLNKNCPVNQESGYIEPEKVLWRGIAVGEKQDLKLAPVIDVGSLYLVASIPHSLNSNREALLDRRGFLHLLVFEASFDPEDAYKNCRFNVLQLIDPLTGLHFPTPVPRSVFPTEKNPQSNAMFKEWERGLMARLKAHLQPQPQPQSASASLDRQQQNFLEYQQAHWHRQQESVIMHSQIMANAHRTRMNIIDNIGGYRDKYRY